MQVDIQALGFKLTNGLREQTERRLRLALGSASSHVRSVIIRLSDDNGPRGGADKRCSIHARLDRTAPAVVIEQQEADLYVAIDRATDRLGRTIFRRLAKIASQRRAAMPATDIGSTDSP